MIVNNIITYYACIIIWYQLPVNYDVMLVLVIVKLEYHQQDELVQVQWQDPSLVAAGIRAASEKHHTIQHHWIYALSSHKLGVVMAMVYFLNKVHSLSSLLCRYSLSSCRSSYSRFLSSNSTKYLSLSSYTFNIFCISSIVSSPFDFFHFLCWSGVTATSLLQACCGTYNVGWLCPL